MSLQTSVSQLKGYNFRMNTKVGSISALLSQKRDSNEDADEMPQGVLLIGDSMVRNIRPEYMDSAQVIKFAYPESTVSQFSGNAVPF